MSQNRAAAQAALVLNRIQQRLVQNARRAPSHLIQVGRRFSGLAITNQYRARAERSALYRIVVHVKRIANRHGPRFSISRAIAR